MQRRIVLALAILALSVSGITGCKKKEEPAPEPAPQTTPAPETTAPAPPPDAPAADSGLTGEQLYKQYCAACHPDGGNTMKPEKTLSAKGMAERSNIKTADDVVRVIRNPGPGMTKFDATTISDADAQKIAEYTLATFP